MGNGFLRQAGADIHIMVITAQPARLYAAGTAGVHGEYYAQMLLFGEYPHHVFAAARSGLPVYGADGIAWPVVAQEQQL